MAIATYSMQTLNATFTQTQLGDAIRTHLQNCGWGTVFDDYVVSNERNLIFQVVHDATRAMGTVFIRIQIALTSAITLTIGTGWNTTTKAMTNGATAIAYSAFVYTSPMRFHLINAFPELSGIVLEQTGTFQPILTLFPAERMTSWDLGIWPFSFLFTTNAFTGLRMPTNSPYTTTDFTNSLAVSQMSTVNRITNRRDLATGMVIYAPTNEGIVGRTSDDIGMGSVNGLSRFNELLDDSLTPNRRHLILNNAAGGLTQRVA